METIIQSNGSRWLGQEPDSVETLLEVLGREPLDPTLEEFGNFIDELDRPATWPDEKVPPEFEGKGMTRFFGNFAKLSHVFNIDTNDPEVVRGLTVAIRDNQKRGDYQRIKADLH